MNSDDNFKCPECGADLTKGESLKQDWTSCGFDLAHIDEGYYEVDEEREEERGAPLPVRCARCKVPIDLDEIGVEE